VRQFLRFDLNLEFSNVSSENRHPRHTMNTEQTRPKYPIGKGAQFHLRAAL
jgi:hypothetical protein